MESKNRTLEIREKKNQKQKHQEREKKQAKTWGNKAKLNKDKKKIKN